MERRKIKGHTTCIKSHTADWFFMSREVGHDTIAVRVLAHEHLYTKREANGSQPLVTKDCARRYTRRRHMALTKEHASTTLEDHSCQHTVRMPLLFSVYKPLTSLVKFISKSLYF